MTNRQQTIGVAALIGVLAAGALGYGLIHGFAPAAAQTTPAPSVTEAPPKAEPDKAPPPATPEQIAAALTPKPTDIGLGDPNAPVKWIEYASAGCPHCAEQDLVTLPKVKAAYIDTGKVYYVLRDFPLDGVSAGASLLARCLPKEKFYPFMDKLFSSQQTWHSRDTKDPKAAIFALAAEMGLTNDQSEACIKDQKNLDALTATVKEADEVLKVDATPTNYINGEKVEGALPFEDLEPKFKAKLGSQ